MSKKRRKIIERVIQESPYNFIRNISKSPAKQSDLLSKARERASCA
jgi:hypothetical protein